MKRLLGGGAVRRDVIGDRGGQHDRRAQSGDEKPKATDVGITDKEIHIAVIADVDNPIVPNLFKGSKDAVEGIGEVPEQQGRRRRARRPQGRGRLLRLEAQRRTRPPTPRSRRARTTSPWSAPRRCSLASVDNMRNCKDSTGAVTGLPDIPFVTTALVHQCSDQSFPIAPPQVECDTKDRAPADLPRQRVAWPLLQREVRQGQAPRRVRVRQRLEVGARLVVRRASVRCVTSASSPTRTSTSPASPTQSAYTPVIQAMKNNGSNYGQAITASAMVLMRKEATLQGLTGVKVWDCGVGCYDKKQFLKAGGSDVEGQYVDTLFLPFYSKADQKANPMLGNYVKYTGKDNIASFGAYAWAAGIAFRDAVNAQVKAGGVNSVTRKTIFEQLNKIHKFDAEGMFAPIDLAGRQISNCSVTLQVKNGDFVRVSPTKPGTFKCWPNGIIDRKLDIFTAS